jgi:UDP-xylose/UDP-N-acetylglucosamine transporter B4
LSRKCDCSKQLSRFTILQHTPQQTGAQYLFTVIEGLAASADKHFRRRTVPLYLHVVFVLLGYGGSLLSNSALLFDVPMPIVLVVKNGNLVCNLLLGSLLLHRWYTRRQVFSVLLITGGIIACTLASPRGRAATLQSGGVVNALADISDAGGFFVGIALLVASLLCGALVGVLSESMFTRYGSTPGEIAFFSNLLGVPLFAPYAGEFWTQLCAWHADAVADVADAVVVPLSGIAAWLGVDDAADAAAAVVADNDSDFGGLAASSAATLSNWLVDVRVSRMWCLLAVNILSSYFLKRFVLRMMSLSSSLSTTLTLTMSKTVSLVVSLVVFNSPSQKAPSGFLWCAVGVTVCGLLAYVVASEQARRALRVASKLQRRRSLSSPSISSSSSSSPSPSSSSSPSSSLDTTVSLSSKSINVNVATARSPASSSSSSSLLPLEPSTSTMTSVTADDDASGDVSDASIDAPAASNSMRKRLARRRSSFTLGLPAYVDGDGDGDVADVESDDSYNDEVGANELPLPTTHGIGSCVPDAVAVT